MAADALRNGSASADALRSGSALDGGHSIPITTPFADLSLDPWTLSLPPKGVESSRHSSSKNAPPPGPLAQGELWQLYGRRYERFHCLVAEDLDRVWCLWSATLRLPLACIRQIQITSVHALQFRIDTFVDGTHVFRAPSVPGALHYWVATLQGLCAHATAVTSPLEWSGAWAATCLQAHWRGRHARRRASLARAEQRQRAVAQARIAAARRGGEARRRSGWRGLGAACRSDARMCS